MSIAFNPSPIPLKKDKHGIYRIIGTRLSLDLVINSFNKGLTCEEIIMQFPTLNLSDTYLIISFYLKNKTEIDKYLRSQERKALAIQNKIQESFPTTNLRNKIIARNTNRNQ